MSASSSRDRFIFMLGLILAGEAVFLLPFNLSRFFKPTMLEVFDLTNTQLGAAQGVYGLVAVGAYFFGGPIADRFEARKLLATSLWSTAAGGLYMATFPSEHGAMCLWGFFGLTTILLFWAALIRATRHWGGHQQQGRAFGLLDAGRGALAATLASLGVAALSWSFPDGAEAATLAQKQSALRIIIYGYTTVTALCGLLVWFALREAGTTADSDESTQTEHVPTAQALRLALRERRVWLQALIVLCAYVGFRGFDNYGLFAREGYGLDEVQAAWVSTIGGWTRPIAALAAGVLGDRFQISKMTVFAFALLLASNLVFAFVAPGASLLPLILGNTLVACTAIFALRGLYFALLEQSEVPVAITGTAVGVVSVIGFTPDIFVGYVAGLFTDANPGLAGHQHFFMFLAAFAALGVLASMWLHRELSGHAAPRSSRSSST